MKDYNEQNFRGPRLLPWVKEYVIKYYNFEFIDVKILVHSNIKSDAGLITIQRILIKERN